MATTSTRDGHALDEQAVRGLPAGCGQGLLDHHAFISSNRWVRHATDLGG